MSRQHWISLTILLFTASGCVRWELSMRRTQWDKEIAELAEAAETTQRPFDARLANPDYSFGWRSGYADVLRGGSGQPPLVPPTEYFDPEVRRPAAAHRVNDWHDGYVHGAMAAQTHGRWNYAELPSGMPPQPAQLEVPFITTSGAFNPVVDPASSQVYPTPLPAVMEPSPAMSTPPPSASTVRPAPPRTPSAASGLPEPLPSPRAALPNEDDLLSPSDAVPSTAPPAMPALPADDDALLPDSEPPPADDDLLANPYVTQQPTLAQSFQRLEDAVTQLKQSPEALATPPTRTSSVDRTASQPWPRTSTPWR